MEAIVNPPIFSFPLGYSDPEGDPIDQIGFRFWEGKTVIELRGAKIYPGSREYQSLEKIAGEGNPLTLMRRSDPVKFSLKERDGIVRLQTNDIAKLLAGLKEEGLVSEGLMLSAIEKDSVEQSIKVAAKMMEATPLGFIEPVRGEQSPEPATQLDRMLAKTRLQIGHMAKYFREHAGELAKAFMGQNVSEVTRRDAEVLSIMVDRQAGVHNNRGLREMELIKGFFDRLEKLNATTVRK